MKAEARVHRVHQASGYENSWIFEVGFGYWFSSSKLFSAAGDSVGWFRESLYFNSYTWYSIKSRYALFSSSEELSRWRGAVTRAGGSRAGASPSAGQVPLPTPRPSPALPCRSCSVGEGGNTQTTLSNHRSCSDTTSQNFTGIFFFFFPPPPPPLFLSSRQQVVHRPTGILGKYSASYPLCMASVLHAVGHISNFRPFSSSSCGPTPARLSRGLPRLPHLSFI